MSTALRILTWFAATADKGGTVDECEMALGLSHQTASPRVHEFIQAGCLKQTSERRRTRSGATACVYVPVVGATFANFMRAAGSPRRVSPELSQHDEVLLRAARAYVRDRPKAQSDKQIKGAILRLVRALNSAIGKEGQ